MYINAEILNYNYAHDDDGWMDAKDYTSSSSAFAASTTGVTVTRG